MRIFLSLIFFILSSTFVNASWQTFQNDLRNTGSSNGTGYFPLKTTNYSDESLGMDFQPLVGDLDNNGNKEIVIFSNNSLVIFNPQLTILNQTKIGSILGQPTLFNFDNDDLIEIIFNSRQNSTDYFFAYQYNNSNLQQEFNITLQNGANFSGIKCLNLNGTNSCVFKDTKNYIHVVNMSPKSDISYNTSIYEERRHTVPAIGDIDNDGNYEAVFWFNEDNNSGYGFLVFDLGNRSLETNFNHSGIVDNIFSPGITIPGDERFEFFRLKGHPVLVDLNNDNKLEIAGSVFYDDGIIGGFRDDWFTELFVYSYNGSKLFSKCESGSVGCNDALEPNNARWEGTNPFVLDFDKNGIDDICFIKDEKISNSFKYMALNCYNYSGDEIARVNLTNDDSVRGIASIADMNNDNNKEIITSKGIHMLINGTLVAAINLGDAAPIAVDIDGNKGLDLVWTFGNQTKVFLDSSNYSVDLSVSAFDISFIKFNSTHINVTSIIKNIGQIEVNNIKTIIYNTETKENKTTNINIRRNGNFTFSAVLGLKEGEKVLVSVDFENEINETDENNNVAEKRFEGLPYVFVSIDNLEPSIIQSEFKNYIKNKLTSGYYTENENEADVKVYIGKNNPINIVNNVRTLEDFEFGYDFGNIIFNDKIGANPYAALVGAFNSSGKIIVMIVGNEIEGDIIGTKEFIKNQVLFLNTKDKEAVFIDDENVDAVRVFDYLHLGGNDEHYNINNNEFKKIVKNALNDEMFNEFNYNVTTSNNILLRLKNLKPNVSSDYLEYLNSTGVPVEVPVVLAHGLFSNLTTWEVLGAEISNTGRDTWLIEITGGPSQDCDDCIDYTFYNLTDIFVPALLNGVLNFTNKDKIQYVGFSNGCRAALDSLERNMFDSNKVETFVAVGCPGAFDHSKDTDSASPISKVLNKDGGSAITSFRNKNLKHVSFSDLAKEIVGIERFFDDKIKISVNLFQQYYNLSVDTSDKEPGENVVINHFFTIQGNLLSNSDGVVSTYDINKTYHNINANKKKYINIPASHLGLDDSTRTKVFVRKILNNETFTSIENLIFVLKSEP